MAGTKNKSRGGTMRAVGIVTTIVLVIAIPLLLVGWWQEWFAMGVGPGQQADQTELTFTVDKGEMSRDMEEASKEGEEFATAVSAAGELETVKGTLVEVKADEKTIAVRNSDTDELVRLKTDDRTDIFIDEQASTLAALSPGSEVAVAYRTTDDTENGAELPLVHKVTVLERAAD